jgi:hypothetical protein
MLVSRLPLLAGTFGRDDANFFLGYLMLPISRTVC